MKNQMKLSIVTVGILSVLNVNAAEDLSSMFSEGKTSGQIREFSISRSMDYSAPTTENYTRSANAIGGYLKFETAAYSGLSLGAALYTTNGFLLGEDKATNKEVDPTLLGKDNESYSILGEAYLQYKAGNTTFKGGRQLLDTPMAGSDDARMLPNLFEAYLVINTDIADTTLIGGHVTKFAQGTFGRAYAGGILSATSGYSAVDSKNQVGDFVNMGDYAIGESTGGVSVASATYTGVKNLKLQLWDYYAHDILNAVYAQADYSWKCLLSDNVKPYASAQLIKEDDVGDKYAGSVNGLYWAAKVGAKIENFDASVAYSATSENDASEAATANAIITPWGGMPAFTQGMVTRHMFLAGTKATKLAASYNWKAFGPNLSTTLYYVNFDMAENNGYTYDDASESGFDVIYSPAMVKNLQLRVRANYADDFNVAQTTGYTTSWDEYRFIANYNF
ncbi:MAG: OprD family porin [Sulfurimonas sp.]|nr:OprD family porin [Sulfurimonas sp.]MBU3939985.1 OprD family porin [bacterium]MBU4024382.1 OprD family porin [bacterium]MBU4058570.1 OprD family porin [bacterium]MBU4110718.1 OprD family porin [bacterium]